MAVAYEMRFQGATLDQYDAVMKLMGRDGSALDTLPDGARYHWCAKTDDGLIVVDVWDTDEQFQRFADEQIGPFTQQVGFTGPPEVTRYEVYNTLPA
jgi:hypothetical protein